MKNEVTKKLNTILLTLMLIICPLFVVCADSGFDNVWDSSSWDSDWSLNDFSSSSYDYDYDYNWSSNNYDYSNETIDTTVEVIFVFIFFIAIIIIAIVFSGIFGAIAHTTNSSEKKGGPKLISMIILFIIFGPGSFFIVLIWTILKDTLIQKDVLNTLEGPGDTKINFFNIEDQQTDDPKFKGKAFDIYKQVQIAWSNKNLLPVKDLLSSDMYYIYETQLESMRKRNVRNVMSDINLERVIVKSINKTKICDLITVVMEVTCHDYLLDEGRNVVIKGDKFTKYDYVYELTFERNKKHKTTNCPNCGGRLNSTSGTVRCQYCDSLLTLGSSEYVLVKKIMLRQRIAG